MAHSTPVRRKLFMHSAHRTIGVSDGGIKLRPYYRIEHFSPDDPLAMPLHTALVAEAQDADACASLASFRRAVERHGDVKYHCVELAAIDAGLENMADVDCVILFRQGLHIARRWADIDVAPYAVDNSCNRQYEPVQIVLDAAARQHPLVDGVGPFESCLDTASYELVPDDAKILLFGRTAIQDRPVAWLEPLDNDHAFRTILGSPEDFRHPDFIRLVLSSLRWIGR